MTIHQLPKRYPFAWAGLYECEAGAPTLEARARVPHAICVVLLRVEGAASDAIANTTERASRLFAANPVQRASGQVVLAGAIHQRLMLGRYGRAYFHTVLPRAGLYVLFTQYMPQAFDLTLVGPSLLNSRSFAPVGPRELRMQRYSRS